MLQTSLLLMKSLNKTIKLRLHFLICSVFFVSKGNLFDIYLLCAFSCVNGIEKLSSAFVYARGREQFCKLHNCL